jgi:hypothetical protein
VDVLHRSDGRILHVDSKVSCASLLASDAGGIEESWRQQPGTPCYTQDYNAVQLNAVLARSVRSRVPEYLKAADDAAKAFFRTAPDR